jgi:predicted NUDIX family phosphoesterase
MERVTCIASELIPDGIYLNGHPDFETLLGKIGRARFWGLRDKTDKSEFALEHNTSIRQLITYICVQDREEMFIYRRTSGTGEKRLAGLYALPGGHMNALTGDFINDISLDATRELREELNIRQLDPVFHEDGTLLPFKILAILQHSACADGINLVNLVHTGIVVKYDVTDRFAVSVKESGKMCDLTRVNGRNYAEYFKESESWLQNLLPLFPQLIVM